MFDAATNLMPYCKVIITGCLCHRLNCVYIISLQVYYEKQVYL